MTRSSKLVAPCGLYCLDCFGYKGNLADQARDLRKLLREIKFERVAEAIPFKEFKNYRQCYEVLGALVKLRCKGCADGGGNPFCKIRKCVQRRGTSGCWECDDYKQCRKLAVLEKVHRGAHLRNLGRIKRMGLAKWVRQGKKEF